MDSSCWLERGRCQQLKGQSSFSLPGLGGSAWVGFQIISSGKTGNPGERRARWDAGGWDRTDVKT